MRRTILIAVVAGLLSGLAQAAEPTDGGALDQLPSQVVGVIGSGDQLSLKLDGGRLLKLGETYADGWRLIALTPAEAQLSRAGSVRRVGLNPTGELAAPTAPDAPPTIVNVTLSAGDLAVLQRQKDEGHWDGAADPGLDFGQTQRFVVYMGKIAQAAQNGVGQPGDFLAQAQAVLSANQYRDFLDLMSRTSDAEAGNGAPDPGAGAKGPSSYYLPAGADRAQTAVAVGIDPDGYWSLGEPDAEGGRVVSRITQDQAQTQWSQTLASARSGAGE